MELIGTLRYQREDYQKAIALVRARAVKLANLATHRFKFEDYDPTYRKIAACPETTMKVLIQKGQR